MPRKGRSRHRQARRGSIQCCRLDHWVGGRCLGWVVIVIQSGAAVTDPGFFCHQLPPAELVELAQYIGMRNRVSSTTAWQESVSALLLDRQVDRNECLGVRTKKGTAKSARIPPVNMSYGRASVGEFPAAFRLSDPKPNPPAREARSVVLLV